MIDFHILQQSQWGQCNTVHSRFLDVYDLLMSTGLSIPCKGGSWTEITPLGGLLHCKWVRHGCTHLPSMGRLQVGKAELFVCFHRWARWRPLLRWLWSQVLSLSKPQCQRVITSVYSISSARLQCPCHILSSTKSSVRHWTHPQTVKVPFASPRMSPGGTVNGTEDT